MACQMSAMTLLPLYWQQHRLSDAEIGWLAAGFSLAAIAVRTWLGEWLERYGRRAFLYLGALLLTGLPLCYPNWGLGFVPWLGVRLLQGAGYGLYITAVLTWVADRSPPDRIAQRQGVFGVSGLLGSAIGPITAEAIAKLYGFSTMFWALGAAGLVATALVATLPESHGVTSQESPAASLKPGDHVAMLMVTFPFGWLVGTIITFIAPLAESVNLPGVGPYFVGFALASVTVRLVSGSFIDRLPPRGLVSISGALMALSALALAALPRYPELALLFSAALLNGIGHGFLFPGLAAYTVRRTSTQQRGAGLALFTGTFDSGNLMGAIAAGYVSHQFGYSRAFMLAAVLLLIALPGFAKLDHSQKPIEPEFLHVDPE